MGIDQSITFLKSFIQGQGARITTAKQLRAKYNSSMEFIIPKNNQEIMKNHNQITQVLKMLILLLQIRNFHQRNLINLKEVNKKTHKMMTINRNRNKIKKQLEKNQENFKKYQKKWINKKRNRKKKMKKWYRKSEILAGKEEEN